MKTAKLSMRDLAQIAGVSVMTVSRSLKNHPSISEKTRKRVQKLAEKHGYIISPLVSAQMARIRANRLIKYEATIALIIYTPTDGLWVGARKIISGVKNACKQTGFKCDVFDLSKKNFSINTLHRMLKSRNIRVLIEAPMIKDLTHYNIDFSELIIVSSNPGSLPQTFHRVCPDHYGNMDMLLRKLFERGFRKPGLLLPQDMDLRTNHLWTSRYLAFQQTENLGKVPPYMPESTAKFSTKVFKEWMEANEPDILITTSQELFETGFFRKAGISIPRDIEVVKVNINDRTKGFSGIDLMSSEVGESCVKLASQLLYQNEYGIPEKPMSIQIPGTWINGSMCPSLNDS